MNDHIKEGQQARPAFERRKILPRALMATEVAVALTLVIGAGLLATSLVRLFKSGAGFDPKGLVNVAFKMDKQQLEGDALMRLYQQLGDGLSHQPGVKSVSFEFIVPLSHRGWNGHYSTPAGGTHQIYMNAVGPDYFATMRIPIVPGPRIQLERHQRLGAEDHPESVSGEEVLSRPERRRPADNQSREKIPMRWLAVVADFKYRDMRAPAPAAAYIPMQQDEQPKPSLTAVVRIEGPQGSGGRSATLGRATGANIPAPVMTTWTMCSTSRSARRE